jgi:hypothetical protein
MRQKPVGEPAATAALNCDMRDLTNRKRMRGISGRTSGPLIAKSISIKDQGCRSDRRPGKAIELTQGDLRHVPTLELREPQGVLLHTSFRHRLAVMPLCFAKPSPPSGWLGNFHPQAIEHARHATLRLMPEPRPGELDGEGSNTWIAPFADPLIHAHSAAVERAWRKPEIARNFTAIIKVSIESFAGRRYRSDLTNALQADECSGLSCTSVALLPCPPLVFPIARLCRFQGGGLACATSRRLQPSGPFPIPIARVQG